MDDTLIYRITQRTTLKRITHTTYPPRDCYNTIMKGTSRKCPNNPDHTMHRAVISIIRDGRRSLSPMAWQCCPECGSCYKTLSLELITGRCSSPQLLICERNPAPEQKTKSQYGHLCESVDFRYENDLFPVRFISIASWDITHRDMGVCES